MCVKIHTFTVKVIMNNKIQEGHKPPATSEVLGGKAGKCT